MKLNKKKLLSTGLAICLAAVLLIGGGSFAYLQDSTGDIVNEFETNKVLVDLTETEDTYEIIPGTAQTKDPTVTVDNTVDAYVYVEVTDATEGLVEYEIADGWTKLDGYDNVYYREVAADADPKTFQVLKDNKVVYDAAIENSDMLDEEGNLKEGIDLTFKAYAIQKEGFADAAAAYAQVLEENDPGVTTADELIAAIENGGTVKLGADMTIDASTLQLPENVDVVLDLNQKTLTLTKEEKSRGLTVGSQRMLTIKDGIMNWPSIDGRNAISVTGTADSVLKIENVEMNLFNNRISVSSSVGATVEILDSEITTTASNCIATGTRSGSTTGEEGSAISIVHSSLTANPSNSDSTAVLFTIPGKLTITDSELKGGHQAVVNRGGNAIITNSILTCTGLYDDTDNDYKDSAWGSGNKTPKAALVVGNRGNGEGYTFDSEVTLEGVTLNAENGCPQIYAASDGNYTTVINSDRSYEIETYGEAVSINLP